MVPDVILDSIADGVFTVDEHWRITSFNRAAEQITGMTSDEALGKPCREVFRASICGGQCALRETRQTGCSIVDKPITIVNQDGRRVPVSISTATLKDHAGHVIGGVETFRDLSQVEQLKNQLQAKCTFANVFGRSPLMRRLFDVLPRFAESNSTILIQGSSGIGKQMFARAIHNLSPRKAGGFIAVHCGALPETLLESELFGHKAGAFLDARHDKSGRFMQAERGTIFLDDIGRVSPAIQSRLLRVLQERVVEPLGSIESTPVDVRVIAATTQDLGRLVHEGKFREDLYYRIHVVRLEVPALRACREDIPLLVGHFIDEFNRQHGKRITGVSAEVMAQLLEYEFPGNVRELENIMEHAFVLCGGDLIQHQHLPPSLRRDDFAQHRDAQGLTLKELEIMHIQQAMRRNGGNRTATARQLGINPSTLFRKLKSLDIEDP